ncbi:MAG: DUF1615 family protein [Candidatus Gracilibacteria bacterium]
MAEGRFDRVKERYDKLPIEKKAEIIKQFSIARRQEIMEVKNPGDYLDTLIKRKYDYLLPIGGSYLYGAVLEDLIEQANIKKPEHVRFGLKFNFKKIDDEIAIAVLGLGTPQPVEYEKPPITKIDQYHYEIGQDEVDILTDIINKDQVSSKYMKVRYPDDTVKFFIKDGDYFYTFSPDEKTTRTEFVALKGMKIEFLPSLTQSISIEQVDILPENLKDFIPPLPNTNPPPRDEPLAIEELNGRRVILRTTALRNLKWATTSLKEEGSDVVLNIGQSMRSATDQESMKVKAPLLADLPNLSAHQTGGAIDISIEAIDKKKQEIDGLNSKIRTIENVAEKEKRPLTSEEQTSIADFKKQIDGINRQIKEITAAKWPKVVQTLNYYGFYNVFSSEPWHFEFMPNKSHNQSRAYDSYDVIDEIHDPSFSEPRFQKRYEFIKKLAKSYCHSDVELQYVALNIEKVIEEVPDFPDTPEALAFVIATFHRESQFKQFPEVNPAQLKKLNDYLIFLDDKPKFVEFCNGKMDEKYPVFSKLVPDSKYEELFDILSPIYKGWKKSLPEGNPQTEFQVGNLLITSLRAGMKTFVEDNNTFWMADLLDIPEKIEEFTQKYSPDSLGIGQINHSKALALFAEHKRQYPASTLGPSSFDFDGVNSYLYTMKGGIAATILYTKNVFYSHGLCSVSNKPPCTEDSIRILHNLNWITADYNAGEFSCRNSFFQKEINDLARWLHLSKQIYLEVDGDLGPKTTDAVKLIFEKCGIEIDASKIAEDLGKIDDSVDKKRAIEDSDTFKRVQSLYRNLSLSRSLRFTINKLGLVKKYPSHIPGILDESPNTLNVIEVLVKEGKIKPFSGADIAAALSGENFVETDLYKELRNFYRKVFLQDSVNTLVSELNIKGLSPIEVTGVFDEKTTKGIFELLKRKGIRMSQDEIAKDLESTNDLALTVTYKELVDYRDRASFQTMMFSLSSGKNYSIDANLAGDATVNAVITLFKDAGKGPNETDEHFAARINPKAIRADLVSKFFKHTVTYDYVIPAISNLNPSYLSTTKFPEELLPVELNDLVPRTLSHSRSKDLNIYVRNYVGGTLLRMMSKLNYEIFVEVRDRYAYRNNKGLNSLTTSDYYEMWPEFSKKYEDCGASCQLFAEANPSDPNAVPAEPEQILDQLVVPIEENEKLGFVKGPENKYTIGGKHISGTGRGFFALTQAKYVSIRREDRDPYLATWDPQKQDYYFRDGSKLAFWNNNNYLIEVVSKAPVFQKIGEGLYKLGGDKIPERPSDFYDFTHALRIGVKINGHDEKIADWDEKKKSYILLPEKGKKQRFKDRILTFYNKYSYELRVAAVEKDEKSKEIIAKPGLIQTAFDTYSLIGVPKKRGLNIVEIIKETPEDFHTISSATYALIEERNVSSQVKSSTGNLYIASRYVKWDKTTKSYRYLDNYNERYVFKNDHRYNIKIVSSNIEKELRAGEDTKPNKFHLRTSAGGYKYVELFGEGISRTGKELHEDLRFKNFNNYICVNGVDASWDEIKQSYLYVRSGLPVEFIGGYKYVIESRQYLPGVQDKIAKDLEKIKQFIAKKGYGDRLKPGANFIFVNKKSDKQYIILATYKGNGEFDILMRDIVSTGKMIEATKAGFHTIQRIPTARSWGKLYGGDRNEYDYRVYDISGESGMALHSTNHPELLGRRASAGCVRISFAFSRQIEDKVKFGTAVIIAEV